MPVTEIFYANHGKSLNRTAILFCIDHEENILLPVLVKISPNSTVPDQVSKLYQNIPSIQFKKTLKFSKLPESPHKYKIWYCIWMYSGNFQNSGVLSKSQLAIFHVFHVLKLPHCGTFFLLCSQPERADETSRIEAAGGRIIYYSGHRVEGSLALSRAIGSFL
jgi:hypothetical protein